MAIYTVSAYFVAENNNQKFSVDHFYNWTATGR